MPSTPPASPSTRSRRESSSAGRVRERQRHAACATRRWGLGAAPRETRRESSSAAPAPVRAGGVARRARRRGGRRVRRGGAPGRRPGHRRGRAGGPDGARAARRTGGRRTRRRVVGDARAADRRRCRRGDRGPRGDPGRLRRPRPRRRRGRQRPGRRGGRRPSSGRALRLRVLRVRPRLRLPHRTRRFAPPATAPDAAHPRPRRVGGDRRRVHGGVPVGVARRLAPHRHDRRRAVGPGAATNRRRSGPVRPCAYVAS